MRRRQDRELVLPPPVALLLEPAGELVTRLHELIKRLAVARVGLLPEAGPS